MLRDEKKTVIKAISDLGHRVTAADVASKTGLPMTSSTAMLNTIAQETGGHLEVSDAGDIAYRFKNNFQSAYLATGIRAFCASVAERIFTAVFYLLKLSFGIFLSLSLVIVIIAFIVLAIVGSQMGNDREDFSLGEIFDFFNLLIFRDLLFWGTVEQMNAPRPQTRNYQIKGSGKSKGNFFIDCFSFLFGDGNPNTNLEEQKWQLTAQTIRENGGVVIQEQLAPYIGPELDDDNLILPVLTRFEGQPVVTAKGRIAYIFPSLQVTTDAQSAGQTNFAPTEGYLKEELWKFTNLSKDALHRIYVVAGLNLFGTWWLYFIFNHLFPLRLPGAQWTLLLIGYSSLFVLIPLCRNIWQGILNQRIKIRNYEREEAAKLVQNPDREMRSKLAERQEFAPSVQIRAVESDHLAYSTEQGSLEQVFEHSEGKADGADDKNDD